MTDYSNLQSLITEYDIHNNRERGYDGAKVEAAFQRFAAECARLGVTVSEGRRLACGSRGTKPVEVEGPAFVLYGSNQIIICDTREGLELADPANRFCKMGIPAGKTHTFTVAA